MEACYFSFSSCIFFIFFTTFFRILLIIVAAWTLLRTLQKGFGKVTRNRSGRIDLKVICYLVWGGSGYFENDFLLETLLIHFLVSP